MKYKKKGKWMGLAGVAVLLAVSIMCLTNANTANKESFSRQGESYKDSVDKPQTAEASDTELSRKEASYTELSQKEIDWFNTVFFNSEDGLNEHNLFLLCTYDKPEQIDLFQVFYNGINGASYQASDDERAELGQIYSEAAYLDIFKITETEMDGCLHSNLGIGLEDVGHSGLDDFIYLEQYDAYYLVHGDSNYTVCTVTSGTKDDEGTVTLQYENLDGIQMEVHLQETEEGYQFLSNVKK